jgi:hypothetical protein
MGYYVGPFPEDVGADITCDYRFGLGIADVTGSSGDEIGEVRLGEDVDVRSIQ